MVTDQEINRRAAAIKEIYRREVELTDSDARQIAQQMGNRLFVSFIVCIVLLVSLSGFLIYRFVF